MLKAFYLSLVLVPLLMFVVTVAPNVVQKEQIALDCAHEMVRHPLTAKCTF